MMRQRTHRHEKKFDSYPSRKKIQHEIMSTVISSYPTDCFNPIINIAITDGDYYEMTLKECVEKLVICDDCLIFRSTLPAFIKKNGNCFEELDANLYNLMNSEHIRDAPEEYWNWFDNEMKRKRELRIQ